jgi:hypothetical protein
MSKLMSKLPKYIFLAPALALFTVPPVLAQTQESMPSEAAPAADVTDAELIRFANAMNAVGGIREQYSQRIQESADADEAQQLQQEAMDKMTTAVEDTGMTVDEYNSIATALRDDEQLLERLQNLVEG